MSANQPSKTYVFPIEVAEAADGRWSAVCPSLPGCASWGQTKDEAIHNIADAVEVYIEDIIAAGESIKGAHEVIDNTAVSVVVP